MISALDHAAVESPDQQIDLWYVRTQDVNDEPTLRACASLMLHDERVKHDAFVFDVHRHEYLVTRALARAVLGEHLERAPADLDFALNAHGRPELSPPSTTHFNLTNTTKLVVCAVVSHREVGVDAEPLDRAADILELSGSVFTSHERDLLGRLEIAARHRRAVELWTIKEAYIKARGLGMTLPVERFEVHFGTEGSNRIELRFFDPIKDDPARWALATCEIEGHLVATCVERHERDDGSAMVVKLHRADLARMLGDGTTNGAAG